MQTRDKWRDLVLTAAAVAVSVLLYHAAGKGIDRLIADDYLSSFLAELVFALLVMATVLWLRQTALFQSDAALLKKGWLSGGLIIASILFFFVLGLLNLPESTATLPQWLLMLGQVVLIGFCEEVLFRGLIQRALHRLMGEDSFAHVFLAILCGGLLFGGAHLINMDRGNPALAAVLQACVNAFMGMYYGAVYFRTGKNIWYNAALHGLYDFAAMLANGRASGATLDSILNFGHGVLTGKSVLVGTLLWGGLYLLPTLFILRPQKLRPLLSKANG